MKSLLDPLTEERALRLLTPFVRLGTGDGSAITEAADDIDASDISWDDVIETAEIQGIAPLLYFHCRECGVDLPESVRRSLKGLYVRHHRSQEIKSSTLGKIVTRCEEAGIDLLLLKGAALAHILYPEPGLRPSSDIDLLVPPAQIGRAKEILTDLEFHWHDEGNPSGKAFEEKHLPPATLFVEGDDVRIDLHHSLLKKGRPNRIGAPDPKAPLLDITVGEDGPAARTLGIEDTLRYLSLHFCDLGHEPISPVTGNSRLIWALDIVSFAARFADRIDWEGLARREPWVIGTLSLLALYIPLPPALESRVPLREGREPEAVGRGYRGWPGTPFAGRKGKERSTLLRETFLPPEWWMRLYYGLGITGTLYYHRALGHPLHIFTHVGRFAARRRRARGGGQRDDNT